MGDLEVGEVVAWVVAAAVTLTALATAWKTFVSPYLVQPWRRNLDERIEDRVMYESQHFITLLHQQAASIGAIATTVEAALADLRQVKVATQELAQRYEQDQVALYQLLAEHGIERRGH